MIRLFDRFFSLFPSLLTTLARALVLGEVNSCRFEHVLIIHTILAIMNTVSIRPEWGNSRGVTRRRNLRLVHRVVDSDEVNVLNQHGL